MSDEHPRQLGSVHRSFILEGEFLFAAELFDLPRRQVGGDVHHRTRECRIDPTD